MPGSCLIWWRVSNKIVTALHLIYWKDGLWYASFVVMQLVHFTLYPEEGCSYNSSKFSSHLLSVLPWGLGHNVLFPNGNARWCPCTSKKKKSHSLVSAWESQKRWKQWSDVTWCDMTCCITVWMCLCFNPHTLFICLVLMTCEAIFSASLW